MKRVIVALLMTALISIGAMAALDTDDYIGGVYFLNLDQEVIAGIRSTGQFDLLGTLNQARTTTADAYTADITTEWTAGADMTAGGSNGIYSICNAVEDVQNAYSLRGRMDLRDATEAIAVNQLHSIDALINLNETQDYTITDNLAVVGAAIHGGTTGDITDGYAGGAKPAGTVNLFYGVWGPTAEQNLDAVTNGLCLVAHEQTYVDYGMSFYNSGYCTAGLYILNHPTYLPATMTAGILMESATNAMTYGIDMTLASITTADIRMQNGEMFANINDGVVTMTGDDVTGIQFQIISADHNTTGDASLVLDADAGGDAADTWTITSEADGNDLSIINAATEVVNITSSGDMQIDGDLTATGGDIIDGSGGGTAVTNKATSVETMGALQKSVVTFTLTGDHDLDLADGDHGTGIKVFDFPEGRIHVLGVVIDSSIVASASFNATANDKFVVSMGTVVAADDNALTGTEADLIPSNSITTDSGAGPNDQLTNDWHSELAAAAVFDGTGGAIDAYVNVACPDAANTTASTYAITGTVTITWVNLGDY